MEREAFNATDEAIYCFITGEFLRNGYAPTIREIGDAVGLLSTSTVQRHMKKLESLGLIYRESLKTGYRVVGLTVGCTCCGKQTTLPWDKNEKEADRA